MQPHAAPEEEWAVNAPSSSNPVSKGWLFSRCSRLFPKAYFYILLLVPLQDIFSSGAQRVGANADETSDFVALVVKDQQDELVLHVAHPRLASD